MTTRGWIIRRLLPGDADAILRLRREALVQEPLAFSSSPAEDRVQVRGALEAYLASSSKAIFGAFDPELVGMAGLAQEQGAKSRHKARLWGVYVTAARRGLGIGRALVEAAIEFAESLDGLTHVHLAVAEPGGAAQALYRHLGFTAWGTEPAALRVGDVSVAEHHMVRALRHGTAQPAKQERAMDSSSQDELVALAHEWDRAMIENDAHAIGLYMADDWVIIGSDGRVGDRAIFLGLVDSGALTHDVMESHDLQVRVYGNAAVVISRGISGGEYQGQPFREVERVSCVFVRADGRWRCVLTHLSRLSPESSP